MIFMKAMNIKILEREFIIIDILRASIAISLMGVISLELPNMTVML